MSEYRCPYNHLLAALLQHETDCVKTKENCAVWKGKLANYKTENLLSCSQRIIKGSSHA